MAQTGLLDSFLAAIQASLSVLLVISYGGIAAHLNLLNSASTKAISKICVRMFLPALLIVDIGSQLHAGSATRYLIIFLWAIVCHFISFLIGIVAHFYLGMPDWTTVALMFNNTTSYPLLLIAALDETGILRALIAKDADETTLMMVARAKSYFLVFATVSSCLTFAVGPRLIDTEHAPEVTEGKEGDIDGEAIDDEESFDAIESRYRDQEDGNAVDERTGLLQSPATYAPVSPGPSERRPRLSFAENSFFPSRRNSFTPGFPGQQHTQVQQGQQRRATRRSSLISMARKRRSSIVPKKHWYKLGPRAKWWLLFISDFFNAPLLGALIGAVIGLVPVLHRAFFSDTYEGGIFTAWLTASLKSIGGLFVPLPVVVAGVSLYTAMKEAREAAASSGGDGVLQNSTHKAGSKMPWLTVTFIMVVRFVAWPAASIAFVYFIAKRGTVLGSDPMLWFAMMLMPTGPPAMKLITLVQVSDAEEEDERNIAKLLTISYLISPVLSFTVVGALRAAQAAMPQ